MVTPENGSITLKGNSGRYYNLNIYISDVIGAYVTFNTAGIAGANSQNFYNIPENCVIEDIALTTGNTVTTNLVIYINDVPVGSVVPEANVLNTLNQRAVPKIGFSSGRKFTLVQA
jgi:hypothetical protein